eukprot:6213992-Pyramimonas_sp.AAC.1
METTRVAKYKYKPEVLVRCWILSGSLRSLHHDMNDAAVQVLRLLCPPAVRDQIVAGILDGSTPLPKKDVLAKCGHKIN